MIKGVLLDVDGTLIESNDAHALSWVEAIRECGIDVDLSAVRKLIGMGGDQLLPKLGIFPENENFSKIRTRKGEIFHARLLPNLEAVDGARELVERLLNKGLKLVAASSASEKDLLALLNQAGLSDLLKNYTSADDAPSSKPEPDILRAALEKIHLLPHEVVMIGDTPYDIYAAKRARISCIAFTCGGFSEQELIAAEEIYEGPQHLLSRLKSSLLGQAKAAA